MNLPSSNSIDIRKLEQMLSKDALTASYKLFWFNGILKEVINKNKVISFRKIVCRMIASAWYPLLQFHLSFGYFDNLNFAVTFIQKKYNIAFDIKEHELVEFLINLNDLEVEKIIKSFYNFVPFRLLTPYFRDELKTVKDSQRNKLIAELSKDSLCFYTILPKTKEIYINDDWCDYIYCNQNIVQGWLYHKLIIFLQSKNPNVPAIPFKISPPHQRELSKAKKIWNEILITSNIKDIYSNKEINTENISTYGVVSIDHFIPWSFVLHDELWNLVPTFSKVNSSKSNRLPSKYKYLDDFCEIQFSVFEVLKGNKKYKKSLEDYLSLNKNLNIGIESKLKTQNYKGEFIKSLKNTINPLYQIAYNQGYDTWENDIYSDFESSELNRVTYKNIIIDEDVGLSKKSIQTIIQS